MSLSNLNDNVIRHGSLATIGWKLKEVESQKVLDASTQAGQDFMFIDPDEWHYQLIGQSPGKVMKLLQTIDGVKTERICAVIKVINLKHDQESEEENEHENDGLSNEPSRI